MSEGAVEGWLHDRPQDQTNFSSEESGEAEGPIHTLREPHLCCCDAQVQRCFRILSGELHFFQCLSCIDHVGACLNCKVLLMEC